MQADVNKRIYLMRAGNHEGDPIPDLADQMLAEHGAVLCFDEFQVTDVADAMIINRLFTCLFARGAIVVATSNRPPHDLYKSGLHRDDIFVPFINTLKERCICHPIQSVTDYRQMGTKGVPVYFTPEPTTATLQNGATVSTITPEATDVSRDAFESAWKDFVDGSSVQEGVVLRTYSGECICHRIHQFTRCVWPIL